VRRLGLIDLACSATRELTGRSKTRNGDDRPSGPESFINPGVLHAERLVNMSKHQYRLEPNVSFTPDQKWVVFRCNMFGPTYAFAVEVEKAK
jgi:hypothetical protein